jgi:hypothetical protein
MRTRFVNLFAFYHHQPALQNPRSARAAQPRSSRHLVFPTSVFSGPLVYSRLRPLRTQHANHVPRLVHTDCHARTH